MEQNNLTIYRVKHIPTGMYYKRRGLSETNGKIYRGENNIITQCAHTKIYVQITDKKVIEKFADTIKKDTLAEKIIYNEKRTNRDYYCT